MYDGRDSTSTTPSPPCATAPASGTPRSTLTPSCGPSTRCSTATRPTSTASCAGWTRSNPLLRDPCVARPWVDCVVIVTEVVEHHAVQLEQPLGRIGLTVSVDVGTAAEPVARLVLATGRQQHVGVGVPEACGPRALRRRTPGRVLEQDDGRVGLIEIAAGAGKHDHQLDARRLVQARHGGIVAVCKGLLGP